MTACVITDSDRRPLSALYRKGPHAAIGCEVDDAIRELSRPGYAELETGWTRPERGTCVVAVRTRGRPCAHRAWSAAEAVHRTR